MAKAETRPDWTLRHLLVNGGKRALPTLNGSCCYGTPFCRKYLPAVLSLFHDMLSAGVYPNRLHLSFAASILQSALSSSTWTFHAFSGKAGCELDPFVASTTLRLYGECGFMDETPKRSTKCLKEMSSLGRARIGGLRMLKSAFLRNTARAIASITMYSKCGIVEDAWSIFERMLHKDCTSWTAMVVGYGMNGFGQDAISLFDRMKEESGIKPGDIPFIEIPSACGDAGLKEGFCRHLYIMLALLIFSVVKAVCKKRTC
ncbi:pentatricopeptide repeat-containing protein At3g20730-like [Nymphaea colorata]|nr:pentatricopeptide repeat-containing protein At3g20730-like [Nymphaea colorata]